MKAQITYGRSPEQTQRLPTCVDEADSRPGLAQWHHDVVEAWRQFLPGLDGVCEVHGHDEFVQVQGTVLEGWNALT